MGRGRGNENTLNARIQCCQGFVNGVPLYFVNLPSHFLFLCQTDAFLKIHRHYMSFSGVTRRANFVSLSHSVFRVCVFLCFCLFSVFVFKIFLSLLRTHYMSISQPAITVLVVPPCARLDALGLGTTCLQQTHGMHSGRVWTTPYTPKHIHTYHTNKQREAQMYEKGMTRGQRK